MLAKWFPPPTGLRLLAVFGPGLGFVLGAFFALHVSGPRRAEPVAPRAPPSQYGLLLMAHGGTPEWNQAVVEAAAAVRVDYPVEIAFGMADAASLQEAVRRLEDSGVDRIGVVRLFISGESWLARTREIVGLDPGAPPRAAHADHAPAAASSAPPPGVAPPTGPAPRPPAAHGGHGMGYWRLATQARFGLSTHGLSEEPAMGEVLAARAVALSTDASTEDVLVLAHGPGDDRENERWLARTDELAGAIRRAKPFRRVTALTLREDWPEKRAEAERRAREFVERAKAEGGRALVIPFRVFGFGPYAKVLAGLDYVSDGRGLLPHPHVTDWIRRQSEALRDGAFRAPRDYASEPTTTSAPTEPR